MPLCDVTSKCVTLPVSGLLVGYMPLCYVTGKFVTSGLHVH